MIKTNEWTISDLVKHLAARNLQPDEIARLQRTAAFPQEDHSAASKSQKRLASDLYEPLDIFRQLGLPVLDWGTKSKWRSSSAEGELPSPYHRRPQLIFPQPSWRSRLD